MVANGRRVTHPHPSLSDPVVTYIVVHPVAPVTAINGAALLSGDHDNY